MKRTVILSLGMLLCCTAMHAQADSRHTLRGTVHDADGQTLPLANIVLYDVADSVTILNHGITDMEGRYEIADVAPGAYCAVLSYVGFRTVRDTLRVTASLTRDYRLEADAGMLGEVEVSGRRMTSSMEKSTYAILPKDLTGRQHALDLLEIIPTLAVDPVSRKVSGMGDKPVKLLINGMNAGETELQSLAPEDVLRLEHYEIPPARYAAYETVVNVVTRKIESGFTGGVNILHAFTTGFGNDMAWFKYNRGGHQLSFDYFLGYRDYDDQRQDMVYDYSFRGVRYGKDAKVRRHFGYGQNVINLTYTFQRGDNSAFQMKLSPNYLDSHVRGASDIRLDADGDATARTGSISNFQGEFNPVLDLYYWHKLTDRDELALNVVGTGFMTSNDYVSREYGGEDMRELLLDNDVDEQNRKYSLIGEAYYSRRLNADRLNIGYSAETYRLNSHVINTFGNNRFSTSFMQHYLYAEWVGQTGKWGYNASFGISRKETDTYADTYSSWILRPFFTLQYSMSPSHRLRLSFERQNSEPSISSLSDNRTYITDHIIGQGNPHLRHSIANRAALNWYLSAGQHATLTLAPFFTYTQSPVNSYFTASDDYIVRASENGRSQRQYGMQYNLRLQPFRSNLVAVTLFGEVTNTELFSTFVGHYSHLYAPFGYRINMLYGAFSASYQGRIVSYRLNGPYLTSDENLSTAEVRYRKGNFTMQASCFWPFTKATYHTRTIPESTVRYDALTRIYDNASMILVGFSWTFSRGKTYGEKNRQLQNRDMDSGVFYK
ncbi:MAG: carboxypeptidase regulatory-like domain-containing protein [Tannerella sp.]|jgi:hypothetical protein|nr:carboxypeptidase regulatory-like domain-containing protein [Tannerella sp.]